MKCRQLNILFSLILLSQISLSAQGDFPFVSENNRWNLVYGGTFSPDISTVGHTFDSELTKIDTNFYHELLYLNEDLISTKSGEYYREDGQKVYKYNEEGDLITYDYDLQPGNVFKYKIYDEIDSFFVLRRDTIALLDGKERIRISLGCSQNISQYDTMRWIQGIGNLAGFTFNPDLSCAIDAEGFLSCYYEFEELIYMSSWASECCISPTLDLRVDNLKLYSNPSTNHITIESPDVNLDGFSLMLYDVSGLRIIKSSLRNHLHTQDISALNSGIYFYQIVSSEGQLVKSGKLFKE